MLRRSIYANALYNRSKKVKRLPASQYGYSNEEISQVTGYTRANNGRLECR